MSDINTYLQTYLFGLLDGNLGAPVADYMATPDVYPHVLLGDWQSVSRNDNSSYGQKGTMSIYVYDKMSNVGSRADVYDIAGAIEQLIEDSPTQKIGGGYNLIDNHISNIVSLPQTQKDNYIVFGQHLRWEFTLQKL